MSYSPKVEHQKKELCKSSFEYCKLVSKNDNTKIATCDEGLQKCLKNDVRVVIKDEAQKILVEQKRIIADYDKIIADDDTLIDKCDSLINKMSTVQMFFLFK